MTSTSGTCLSCKGHDAVGAAGPRNVFPIDDARHNVWLLACELSALEGHLQAGRRCAKCVTKHLATVESLAREGMTLDHAAGDWALFERVIATVAAAGWQVNVHPSAAAAQLRAVRRAVCERQLQLAGLPNVLR